MRDSTAIVFSLQTWLNGFPVPILAASDLIQALTLIIATFGFYSDFFITFDRRKTGGE